LNDRCIPDLNGVDADINAGAKTLSLERRSITNLASVEPSTCTWMDDRWQHISVAFCF